MKKVLGIMAVAAFVFCSCGKTCNCTYYEDGKKVAGTSSAQQSGTKFFNKEACTKNSTEKYQTYSIIVEGKEVTAQTICK